MTKVTVEFINTCPCCDQYGHIIRSAAARYGEMVECTIYHAGKDFGYLRKYGPINKGTMIINGVKKYDILSRDIIEKALADAVRDKDN